MDNLIEWLKNLLSESEQNKEISMYKIRSDNPNTNGTYIISYGEQVSINKVFELAIEEALKTFDPKKLWL